MYIRRGLGQYWTGTLVDPETLLGVEGLAPVVKLAIDGSSAYDGMGAIEDIGDGQYRYHFTEDDTDGHAVSVLMYADGVVGDRAIILPFEFGLLEVSVDGGPSYDQVGLLTFAPAGAWDLSEVTTGEVLLELLPASATNPGLVNTGAQEFEGGKVFLAPVGSDNQHSGFYHVDPTQPGVSARFGLAWTTDPLTPGLRLWFRENSSGRDSLLTLSNIPAGDHVAYLWGLTDPATPERASYAVQDGSGVPHVGLWDTLLGLDVSGGLVTGGTPEVDWSEVSNTPTTLAGYGITDAATDAELAAHEADTIAVHGIANTADLLTDADVGTMAAQDADSVNIDGGTVDGVTLTTDQPVQLDGPAIGGGLARETHLFLTNPTAATLGTQQNAPALEWEAHSWNTTTGTSRLVSFVADVMGESGAGDVATWRLAFRSPGGTTAVMWIDEGGNLVTSGSIDPASYVGITWGEVSKSGSSLADLATRSAADLSSGNLATARLPGGDWVGAQSGESVLGANYDITASSGTFADTGLSISLPAAGTYLVGLRARTKIGHSAGGPSYIVYRLYNTTDSAVVSNTETMGMVAFTTTVQEEGTNGAPYLITVAGAKTLRLEASRNGATTYTLSTVGSDANGRTALSYVRVA